MAKRKSIKGQQRSTKHTHKTKDRVTRTPLQTGIDLKCSGRVVSFCSTSGTRCVNLVANPVICHEWEKDWEVLTTSGTYPWSFVTQIFHSGQSCHGGFNLTNRNPWFSSSYRGNPGRNHKLWNIVPTERYMLHMQVLLACCCI